MPTLATPGLYRQPLEPKVSPGPLLRSDVAAFLGYTARGPVAVPVRVESLSQFEQVFGTALALGYLWHAMKGFFECGGRAAYVVRLAGSTARTARADLGGGWSAQAAFSWPLVDPRRLNAEGDPNTAIWRNRVEAEIRRDGPQRADPGVWGNQIEVTISRASLLITTTTAEELAGGKASRFRSLAGLEPTSVLQLTQARRDKVVTHTLSPARIEPAFKLVHWPVTLGSLGFAPAESIEVSSVEFDVGILSAGTIEQTFLALAPHPEHPRAISRILALKCRSLRVTAPEAGTVSKEWHHEENLPAEGHRTLAGGADGLESVDVQTWELGLAELATLSDAALIAAPDLMLADTAPPPPPTSSPIAPSCDVLAPPASGRLQGSVVTTDQSGTALDLPGVLVDVAGSSAAATTDIEGAFALSGLPLGLVTLRLTKMGFAPLETVAQSAAFPIKPAPVFTMAQLSTPAALAVDDRARLQQAMGNAAVVGPYKVAIIDAPHPDADIECLEAWRANLGDAPRLALFAPWLILPAPDRPGGQLTCPPSGHICGAFAHAELTSGIHRSGANLPLRYVEGTSSSISDADQAGLNPAGINAIRAFPGRGIRAFGTRTLAAAAEWRFVTTRRTVDGIERTLERAMAWMAFEPNSDITRQAVQTSATSFLDLLRRRGILAGGQPDGAYRVKCDLENNPATDREGGRLILDIAVAPAVPFEFVIFRLGHTFDALQVTERLR
ncbi:MAG: phage tail sheath C-terminal domain-containing protein [Acidimicrobiia bacterium]